MLRLPVFGLFCLVIVAAACAGGSDATRNQLSACIDSATFSIEELSFGDGEGIPDGGVERVTEVLEEITQHPFFDDDRPIVVESGCPMRPPDTWLSSESIAPIQRIRGTFREDDDLGPYRAYVFFLPEADLRELVAGSDTRTATQEITCTGDICIFRSVAAYLSRADLDDRATLVDAMEHVTLLSQVSPTLPPGETPSPPAGIGTPPAR